MTENGIQGTAGAESFAGAPMSIAEARADKADCAALWPVRDMLVAMLREIDKGNLDVEAMVVFFTTKVTDPGNAPLENCVSSTRWYSAGTRNAYEAIGMVHYGIRRIMNELDKSS